MQEYQQAEGEALDVNGFPMDATTPEAQEAGTEVEVEAQVEAEVDVETQVAEMETEAAAEAARPYFEEWSPMSKEEEAIKLKVNEVRLGG